MQNLFENVHTVREEEATWSGASKEHNDLLRNAEKKAHKGYKKPATSLIQGTM